MDIKIGIDPGVKTGIAVANGGELLMLKTWTAVKAENYILNNFLLAEITIILENSWQKTWYGKDQKKRAQGAGSNRRDSSRWMEFCEYHKINCLKLPPQKNPYKEDPEGFKRVTGWQGSTSEHSRDAGWLIYKMNNNNFYERVKAQQENTTKRGRNKRATARPIRRR